MTSRKLIRAESIIASQHSISWHQRTTVSQNQSKRSDDAFEFAKELLFDDRVQIAESWRLLTF